MDKKYSRTQQFPLAKDNPLRMDLDVDFEKQGPCLFTTVLGACDYDTRRTCC